jgi:hypothetical protein
LTPLMLAAEEGHTAVVRALIDHEADIHARTRTGATPARGCPSQSVGLRVPRCGIIRGGLPGEGQRAPIPAR